MKAIVLEEPGLAGVKNVAEPTAGEDDVVLQVRMVGLCGSDLNSYRGRNPLVSYPRIPGHEISATVVDPGSHQEWEPGTPVTLSPYKACGRCAACERGRPNACRDNQTLGVQRDGALTELIAVPACEVISREPLAEGALPGRAVDGGLPCGGSRSRDRRGYGRRVWLRRRGAGCGGRRGVSWCAGDRYRSG